MPGGPVFGTGLYCRGSFFQGQGPGPVFRQFRIENTCMRNKEHLIEKSNLGFFIVKFFVSMKFSFVAKM